MLPTSSKKTASKKLESIKFVGGSKFMKELQKTVFFAAYDSVVFSSGRSMTEKEQKELLRTSIIGSGAVDEMTLPEQMVLGLNQFSHLYDEVDIDVNDDRNALSSVSEGVLVVDRHRSTEEGGEKTLSPQMYDKKLKDCFFPQKSSGGKLAIYANKSDGITKSLLIAKNLSNPVDVSVSTIMRGAKEVLRNGRKALACAKDSESDYKDGSLPSGRTIADYHRYIRERMYLKLRGGTGAATSDDADDDLFATSDNEKDDLQDGEELLDASQMPDDYYFTGMIAFFLWGFIVESPEQDVYRSKQFQISDSRREEKGLNSRKAIKKEAASMSSKQQNAGTGAGASVGSPFRRGATLSQQIEIAKLHTARTIEERRSVDSEYSTKLANIQLEIDNKLLMAQLWQVTNRDDVIFKEIQQLMQKKRELAEHFENSNAQLNFKRRQTDAMLDEAFGSRIAPRGRTSLSNNTTGDDTSTAMTRASFAPPPTSFVDVPRSHQTNEAVMPSSPENDVQSPDSDVPHSQQTNEATIQQSPDNDKELYYADCTYDLRD